LSINNTNTDYKTGTTQYSSAPEPDGSGMLFKKRIWRVGDVASFLGCSIGHIYNLVSDEKIPKFKKGKFLFFAPEMILEWIKEGNLI